MKTEKNNNCTVERRGGEKGEEKAATQDERL